MLHWGVRKGRKDWVQPPKEMWTSGTKQAGDIAMETSFQSDGGTVEHAGDTINLQKLELEVDSGVSVTGLTFVIRSDDNSAWYRDGPLFYDHRSANTCHPKLLLCMLLSSIIGGHELPQACLCTVPSRMQNYQLHVYSFAATPQCWIRPSSVQSYLSC